MCSSRTEIRQVHSINSCLLFCGHQISDRLLAPFDIVIHTNANGEEGGYIYPLNFSLRYLSMYEASNYLIRLLATAAFSI